MQVFPVEPRKPALLLDILDSVGAEPKSFGRIVTVTSEIENESLFDFQFYHLISFHRGYASTLYGLYLFLVPRIVR